MGVPLESIFSIPPLETGGTTARRGYLFQDHIAADFCIGMLMGTGDFDEVWCETLDDITLVTNSSDSEPTVEFVQVKGGQPHKVWTVADLCRQKKPPGTKSVKKMSILERSLEHDRTEAKPLFRVVTRSGVDEQLDVLLKPLFSPVRNGPKMEQLKKECKDRIDPFKSPNGNDAAFWVTNCIWEWRGNVREIESCNRESLQEYLESQNGPVPMRHVRQIYREILTSVQESAAAEWATNPNAKKIKKKELATTIKAKLEALIQEGAFGAGGSLAAKMEAAGLPKTDISAAEEQRVRYLGEVYTPKYLTPSDHLLVDGEVLATLQALRAKLSAGAITDNGTEFHARCISALEELRVALPTAVAIPKFVVQGSMYSITDRCRHSFVL